MNHPRSLFVLTLRCPDQPGIVNAVSTFLLEHQSNIIDSMQFGDPSSGTFTMRISFRCDKNLQNGIDDLETAFIPIAKRFAMISAFHDSQVKSRVIIMVSKFDHCLNDLLYRQRVGELAMDIVAVVSNHPDAKRLVLSHNIRFEHLPVSAETKKDQEKRLMDIVEAEQADFIILARYMQVLSTEFCTAMPERIINIHHSFLPGFKGARPYHQAYDRGVKVIGATAHYVTSDLDEGPIIEQGVKRVGHAMSAEQLVEAGRSVEQNVLADAVKYQIEHRIQLIGHRTVIFR